MSYWRLHYHAVWACKNHLGLITPELQPQLYQYILSKGCQFNAIIHAVGGIEDHLHVVFSLAPKYAIADFIGGLKGSSSHWVSHVLKHPEPFDWQRGYGVVSFGDRHFRQVVFYVRNQKEHHQKQTINHLMEKWSDEEDGVQLAWDDAMQAPPPANESVR